MIAALYSRRHKKVPVPYSYYDRKTLRPYYGANRNYDSPIYSVIARFLRVNNARAWGSLRGFQLLLADHAHSFCKQIDDEASEAVWSKKSFDSKRKLT